MVETEDRLAQRGPNFKLAEDLQVCYAWIATSEDATVGTNMRNTDFKEKFHTKYVNLIKKYNTDMYTDYGNRNAVGCYNRFKKISRGLLKYLGTENSAGSVPSGDTDKEKWNDKVTELFNKRYPEFVKMVDSIQACKDILGDKPKWRAFQDEEETEEAKGQKKPRPEGSKKAKDKKADREFLEQFLTVNAAKQDAVKLDHIRKKEEFMGEVSTVIKDAFTMYNSNMKRQNELKLIDMLSPASKKQMAKQMLQQSIGTPNTTPTEIHVDNNASAFESVTTDSEDTIQVSILN